jgi:hypothetical protein
MKSKLKISEEMLNVALIAPINSTQRLRSLARKEKLSNDGEYCTHKAVKQLAIKLV